jgi:hypothetical protein
MRTTVARRGWPFPLPVFLIVLIALSGACGGPAGDGGLAAPSAALPAGIEVCTPTDQDRYVYRPARLEALASCIRVVGTVIGSSTEADGDIHINIRLDDAYRGVLKPGNEFEAGDLIVEPVCQVAPPQADAIRICASDPAPLERVPRAGDHVWLEGRYVLDLQHHAWAELHPLYRWDVAGP